MDTRSIKVANSSWRVEVANGGVSEYRKRVASHIRGTKRTWVTARSYRLYRHLADMPYDEYLRTDYWKQRRKSVIKRRGMKCQKCSSNGMLHVHHLTYERRGRENPNDLMVLCPTHHKREHKNGSNKNGSKKANHSGSGHGPTRPFVRNAKWNKRTKGTRVAD